jgi:hypothetical protein
MEMFYVKPITEWSETLNTLEIEADYFITFGAIGATLICLSFPKLIASLMTKTLLNLLLPVDNAEYLINVYMPVLYDAAQGAMKNVTFL